MKIIWSYCKRFTIVWPTLLLPFGIPQMSLLWRRKVPAYRSLHCIYMKPFQRARCWTRLWPVLWNGKQPACKSICQLYSTNKGLWVSCPQKSSCCLEKQGNVATLSRHKETLLLRTVVWVPWQKQSETNLAESFQFCCYFVASSEFCPSVISCRLIGESICYIILHPNPCVFRNSTNSKYQSTTQVWMNQSDFYC